MDNPTYTVDELQMTQLKENERPQVLSFLAHAANVMVAIEFVLHFQLKT